MTSGAFHSVAIDSIKVEVRQRKRLKGIDVLADSIRRLGLIHPIVIRRDLTLVAGERRLSACKALKLDRINCQYVEELDEPTLRAIELEENVKRHDLDFWDTAQAITDYHELRCTSDRTWTQARTGDALGLDQSTISQSLKLIREKRNGNQSVINAASFSTARNIIQRQESRRDQAAAISLEQLKGGLSPRDSIQVADFNQWAPNYVGLNFLHCDFPYGINANKMQQGDSVAVYGGYDDSEEVYWRLLDTLCRHLDRFCEKGAHIMFWFSMHYYTRTLEFFARNSDFRIDPFPLIWVKSNNAGLLPDANRGPRRIYETCLFGSRGDRKIVGPISNALAAPTDHEQHMSTKPETVLHNFFRMFVDETSHVLDPTCGSGTAICAAESLGAARVLGLEINKEFAERASLALATSRREENDNAA
jgi:ParB/RepB/Spo0J family partition protein